MFCLLDSGCNVKQFLDELCHIPHVLNFARMANNSYLPMSFAFIGTSIAKHDADEFSEAFGF